MRLRLSRSAPGAALLLAAGLVAGCAQPPDPTAPTLSSTTTESAAAAADPNELQWAACPEGTEPADTEPSGLQCAAVTVPLDYADPDGTQIDVMISRLPSTDPAQRRGVLLLNPGGPGGSGLDQPLFLAGRDISPEVLAAYDLIGIDTRGVGQSAPISCGFTNGDAYNGNIPPYAVDEAAVAERAPIVEEIAQSCAANDTDGVLPHITTANIARDLDRIRAALGEDTASFLGYSYGTALGAAYTSMFPNTTDRVVLDSNIGDTHLDRAGLRRYALGMEETFPDFARWAADRNDRYQLGQTPEEVRATYFELANRFDRDPLGPLDGATFRLSTFASLYHVNLYPDLADAWQDARGPNPDLAVPGPAPDPAALRPFDNAWSAFLTVTCNDVEWPADIATYQQAVAEDREQFPLYGAASANILPCAYWPIERTEGPVPINQDGPANVLVVQNQRDPVTPLRGGQLLNEAFGDLSRLLEVDGSGHGVYAIGTNPCAQELVTSFLVDGTMPERDVVCEAI